MFIYRLIEPTFKPLNEKSPVSEKLTGPVYLTYLYSTTK